MDNNKTEYTVHEPHWWCDG